MRRAALSALLVAGALLLQLTVVNRLPLPGGGAPDLVLLVVIALALCGGPETGMLTGFCAGLSLDLAPPASQLIGEYALVFCVIGYGCGKLRGALGRSALLPLVAPAPAAAAAEVLYAGLGRVVDPAQVTWATVRQVLPSSVAYDAVISSPVMFLVMLASRWVNDRARDGWPEPRRAGGSVLLGGAGRLASRRGSGAARKVGTGRAPRIRAAATRQADGWLGGRPPAWRAAAGQLPRRAAPRLRPGAGLAGSAARSQQAGRRQVRSPGGRPHAPGFHPARFQPGQARPARGRPAWARSAWGRPTRSRPAWTRAPGARPARTRAEIQLGPQRRPVNLRLAAGRRGGKFRGAAGDARSGRGDLPRIAFSGRGGGGRTSGWSTGTGSGTVRPGAGRPARSPGFRPAAGFRGGSAAGSRAVGLRPGRAARFGPVRRSLVSIWALGRAGRRSNAWRIGSRRTGGSR